MTFRLFQAAAVSLAVMACNAQAGEIVEAATAVEAAIAAGDFDAWYAANEDLENKAWAASGLHFGNLVQTTGDASGYGVYEARGNSVYAPGEPVHLYVEPRGYGYGDAGNGGHEIAFDIDLKVLDSAGSVLVEAPDFAQFAMQTKALARELMVNVTVNLDGAPVGDYRLELTFRDKHGGQSASFNSDISIQ